MEWLIEFLERILAWLLEVLLWVPRKLWELILDGLAWVVENIPVPTWLGNAGSFFSGIDPGIVYYLEGFAFAEGVAIVIGAYVIRFLIRRIPLIG